MAEERAVLLGAYDAKRCARRVHNEWDPTIAKVSTEVPPAVQLRFDTGAEFEERVRAQLREARGPARYVEVDDTLGKSRAIDATLAAMTAGVDVVIGGWLPDDLAGGRKGRPDLLVRAADGSGYQPGEIKAHLMTRTKAKGSLRFSTLADPAAPREVAGWSSRASERFDDFLQIAHYWRMLEACGRAAKSAAGFVIGTDVLPALGGMVLVWQDLGESRFPTYSRSRGKTRRSVLERCDHEQSFRVTVATAAAARTEASTDEPMVSPVFVDECKGCPWFDYCLDLAGPEAPSAHFTTGNLTRREWLALDKLGFSTLESIQGLDVADPAFGDRYLPEVAHLTQPLDRLADVVHRAKMIGSGIELERIGTGPIAVPRADIEIDFDIEWGADQRVYLWGALVHRPGEAPGYQPVVSWEHLDAVSEHRLAEEFAAWLREVIAGADRAGQTVRVYHYSSVESVQLARVLGADSVADLVEVFVDLHPLVKRNYFGVHGLGIKQVAPHFGFAWRDDDPSGLQSQVWLVEAQDEGDWEGAQVARQRLLDYNEDDVAATAVVRAGLAASTP